ncbi:MAG: APC family permease [Candidatus Jordarchaeum sp.]|uniref:APC family permease n=1 Tax=Candidatus Jordarchaeum sp. TaxID=2823881 RepID=UPI004049A39C
MARKIVFTRDATGLIREVSIKDAFMIVFSLVIGGGILFLSVQALQPGYFPGANLSVSYLLGLVFVLPLYMVYAIFSRAMPRSGGDYIFVSRVLGPGWGFVASWGVWISTLLTMGILAFQSVSFLSYFVMLYGLYSWNLNFVGWAIWLTDPIWGIILGVVLVLVLGGILMASVRTSLWLIRILFLIPIFGALATVWILFTRSPMDMLFAWNTIFGWGTTTTNIFGAFGDLFRVAFMVPVQYWYLLTYANSLSGSTSATLAAVIVAMFALGGGYSLSIIGGEVRDTRRTFYIAMVGSIILIALLYVGLLYPLQSNWGAFIQMYAYLTYTKDPLFGMLWWSLPQFGGGLSWLSGWGSMLSKDTLQYWVMYGGWFYAGKLPTPFPASIPLFAAPLAGLNWLGLFIVFAGLLWLINAIIPMLFTTSRYVFAWSFDRVVPTKLSVLNERTTTPIYAIGLSMLVAIIGIFLCSVSTIQAAINAVFLGIASIILTVIAGILFNRRRKDIAERTYNPKIGKVPLLLICGLISAIFAVPLILGALVTFTMESFVVIILVYLIGAAIYFYMRRRNRKAGIDLAEIFRSIPPD